jgi:hypothetical protein
MMTTDKSVWLQAGREVFSPASLLQIAGITYLAIGVCVVFYVFFRYPWLRRRVDDTTPWPGSENPQQGLKLFFILGALHPLSLLLQVVLWPLWLTFLWAYQPDSDDGSDEEPTAIADPIPARPMEPGPDRFRILRFAAISLTTFAILQAYRFAQAPPDKRSFQIITTVSGLSVLAGLVLFKFFYPERSISRIALVVITLVLIAIAVIFGHHSQPG